jgi:hypothetical protein
MLHRVYVHAIADDDALAPVALPAAAAWDDGAVLGG